MEKDYLDIAYTKRVERSQVLVDNLIKVFPEYFKNLSICQQRNLAIILNNTIKWLHSLSSKQLENDEIDSAYFLKNTINSYLKLIENGIEVIGLEVPFTTFKSNDNKMTYCIKASCQYQNADDLIKKCERYASLKAWHLLLSSRLLLSSCFIQCSSLQCKHC